MSASVAPGSGGAGPEGRRRALVISYDGASYAGWQVQPDRPTVQGTVETALAEVMQTRVRIVGAGRTDAGVHALGQVAHFDDPRGLPVERVAGALNGLLPGDVRVRGVVAVPADFHAMGSAVDKTYAYQLHLSRTVGGQRAVEASVPPLRRRTHHAVRADLDVAAMRAAAARLAGRRDWTALSKSMPEGRSTLKSVRAVRVLAGPRRLRIVATADGFLYGMVRLLAGLLVEVGAGRRRPEDIDALLAAGDRAAAPASLPAHALCLWMVRYRLHGEDGAGPRRLLS